MELELVTRAAVFAGEAHRLQMRKEGSEPYINHPLRVANACVRAGLSAEAVAAALLHDVVEDTAVTQDEVDAAFGPEIGRLVAVLTKAWPDDAPAEVKRVGKPPYYAGIAADPVATAIKLLDRADNLESMVRMLPARSDWALRYWRQTAQEVGPLAARCRNQVAVEAYDTGHARLKAKLKALGLDP